MRETPVLDWDPVPDADLYMVYVSRDRNFQNMVYGSYSDSGSLPRTTNTRWSPTIAMPDSQAGVAYYWFVRPCKSYDNCAPDPLKANHAFDKTSPTVQGLQVSADDGDDITFSWQDYGATSQNPANASPSTGEVGTQTAMSYRVQVATNEAFTNIIDDNTVDQTTYTSADRLYPEGQLYWRVQVVDGSGNLLTLPSTASTFTKASPAPQLLGPSGPSPATQPFQWSASNYASSYTLEVYQNGDTAASPSNLVLSQGGVQQTAWADFQELPSGTSYVWRVRRVDSAGNNGPWSAWGQFQVQPGMPALVSPAAGVRLPVRDSLFTWTAVTGAASYRWERRAAGSTNGEVVTTRASAWAPTGQLATGSYQWRVSALDSSDHVMGTSDWRAFSVDATVPTITKRKPDGGLKVKAAITLTFSEKVQGVSAKTIQLKGKGKGGKVKFKVKLDKSGTKAKISHKGRLKKGAVYQLKIKDGITDVAGNPLAAATFSYTVS
ncbi:Ig-like domain-containing protein [Nocardioides anomalus]|nr:Ig-like domain-containing protein [Nocardioides anomalus]